MSPRSISTTSFAFSCSSIGIKSIVFCSTMFKIIFTKSTSILTTYVINVSTTSTLLALVLHWSCLSQCIFNIRLHLSSIPCLQISFTPQTPHAIHIINCSLLIRCISCYFLKCLHLKKRSKNKIRTATNTI